MDKERETLFQVLHENGLTSIPSDLHSWRCEHVDRYGECNCLDGLMDDLMKWRNE